MFQYHSPTELLLPIAAAVQERAERQSESLPEFARWTAYLNAICLETVLPWLQTEYDPDAQVWLADELPALWGLVNGSAIVLNRKRFILIPSKEIVTLQLIVPQEWIDLPTWAGDYFLAVQIDPIDQWLRIDGYATHAQIKTEGEYAAGDRTYALDLTQIVADIAALSVIYQLNPQEQTQAAIQPLPTLTEAQADALLQSLSAGTVPIGDRISFSRIPFAQIPFAQWGELLRQSQTRRQLYAFCTPVQTSQSPALPQRTIHLANWLQQRFEAGWESLDRLLSNDARLAFSLRQEMAGVARARSIGLADDHFVTLVVILEAASPSQAEAASPQIQIRLYPGDRPFPENLSLALLTPDGAIVQQVQAAPEATFIQLKRFRCRTGRSFVVQVALAADREASAAAGDSLLIVFTEQFVG